MQAKKVINKLKYELITAADSTAAIKEVPAYVSGVWRRGRDKGLHIVANNSGGTSQLTLEFSELDDTSHLDD